MRLRRRLSRRRRSLRMRRSRRMRLRRRRRSISGGLGGTMITV